MNPHGLCSYATADESAKEQFSQPVRLNYPLLVVWKPDKPLERVIAGCRRRQHTRKTPVITKKFIADQLPSKGLNYGSGLCVRFGKA